MRYDRCNLCLKNQKARGRSQVSGSDSSSDNETELQQEQEKWVVFTLTPLVA